MVNNVEKRLETLIAYRSTTDNQLQVKALLDDVVEQLAETPMHIRRYENNGIHSLVATSRDTKSPKIWLVAHVDVVAGSDELFSLKIEDDKLIGRGAADDKFAVAAFLEAIIQLGDAVSQYDFGLMLTGDEETGGDDGVRYLVQDEGYRGEAVFVPDGGNGWQIETQAKGALRFLVQAEGTSAHGSRPWLGEDAIEKLLRVVADIKKELQIPPLEEAERGYTRTLNMGVIRGGEAANQVPAHAEAQIDIRYILPEETAKIKAIVSEVVGRYARVNSEVIAYVAPVFTKENDPWVQQFKGILENMHLYNGTVRSFGGTDARYFTETGATAIVSMPQGGDLHAHDEWLERKGLQELVEVTRRLIQLS